MMDCVAWNTANGVSAGDGGSTIQPDESSPGERWWDNTWHLAGTIFLGCNLPLLGHFQFSLLLTCSDGGRGLDVDGALSRSRVCWSGNSCGAGRETEMGMRQIHFPSGRMGSGSLRKIRLKWKGGNQRREDGTREITENNRKQCWDVRHEGWACRRKANRE